MQKEMISLIFYLLYFLRGKFLRPALCRCYRVTAHIPLLRVYLFLCLCPFPSNQQTHETIALPCCPPGGWAVAWASSHCTACGAHSLAQSFSPLSVGDALPTLPSL